MSKRTVVAAILFGAALTVPAAAAYAWHDATHMAVARAAGIDEAYLAVGPDIAKEKAGDVEGGNHYNNNRKGEKVTPELVLGQYGDYNKPGDGDGHLYGAIVASVTDYLLREAGGKYAMYPLGYAAHYIADLSMPLHNIEYNQFNRANHSLNDGIVENSGPRGENIEAKVARISGEIRKRMAKLPPVLLGSDRRGFYRDLAGAVAALANNSAALGWAMQDADPPRSTMTEEEAYRQLAQSAQLLKAVYRAK